VSSQSNKEEATKMKEKDPVAELQAKVEKLTVAYEEARIGLKEQEVVVERSRIEALRARDELKALIRAIRGER